jgi:beta-glucosidase-like glycosyl hydrolase
MRHVYLILVATLAACGGVGPETEPAPWAYGPKADWTQEQLRGAIGGVFLVEQFTAQVSSQMVNNIQLRPPGGILFWNGTAATRADAVKLRAVIATYSEAARAAGHGPILFSTDYEGGALKRSLTWKKIPGIQRFTDGFTALAHPRWLGQAYRTSPDLGRELARLHGEIIARELRSVGLNYPLSVVGDLAYGLFAVRGIDTDEQIVAELMPEVLDGALSEAGMLFVTKHFPGLGQTSGDTHDNVVTSKVTDPVVAERHLLPFRTAVEHLAGTPDAARLSLMCGHAVFPLFDAELNTTTSPSILQQLLREDPEGTMPVQPLGFEGIALSDAMWMGPYGTLSWSKLKLVYLESFLAGMDMLMIPGSRYGQAREYFAAVLDDQLSASERAAAEAALGAPWATLHQRFMARLEQSLNRIGAAQARLSHAQDLIDDPDVIPTDVTGVKRQRYHEILKQVDPRWIAELP